MAFNDRWTDIQPGSNYSPENYNKLQDYGTFSPDMPSTMVSEHMPDTPLPRERPAFAPDLEAPIDVADRRVAGVGGPSAGDTGGGGYSGQPMSFAPAPELGTRDDSGKQAGFGGLLGFLSNPLNLPPDLRRAGLAAGFSMMASRSPYLGNAIGEGGLAGLSAYSGAQKEAFNEDKALKQLQQHADDAKSKLAFETKKLETMTPYQREHLDFLKEQAKERLEAGKYTALPGMGTNDKGESVPGSYIMNTRTGQTEFRPGLVQTPKGAAGESSFDNNTLTKMADQYLAGDKSVLVNLGRGTQGATDLKALRRRIVERMDEQGITPAQQAVKMQEFAGLGAGERALGTRTAQIEMAANEARNMMKPALEAAAAVPRTNFVPVNKLIEAWQTGGVSDPAQARFAAANFSLVNTYVRAIAPTGVPPESARNHALQMLSGAMSHESYKAVIDQMNIEMEAALKSPGQVQQKFRELHGGAAAPAEAPAGPAAAGGGFTGRTATNPQTGQRLRETASGQWVQ
jgi:hypothetical protein